MNMNSCLKALVITLSVFFFIFSATSFAEQQSQEKNDEQVIKDDESKVEKTITFTRNKEKQEKLRKEREELEIKLEYGEPWKPGPKTRAVVTGGGLLFGVGYLCNRYFPGKAHNVYLGIRDLYNRYFPGNVPNVHNGNIGNNQGPQIGESASDTTDDIRGNEDIRRRRTSFFDRLSPASAIVLGGSADIVVAPPPQSLDTTPTVPQGSVTQQEQQVPSCTTTTPTASQESAAQQEQRLEELVQFIEQRLEGYYETIRRMVTNTREAAIGDTIQYINAQIDELIARARTDIPMNNPKKETKEIRERILIKCYIYKIVLVIMQPRIDTFFLLDATKALYDQLRRLSRDWTLQELAKFCYEIDNDCLCLDNPSDLPIFQVLSALFNPSLNDADTEYMLSAINNDVLRCLIKCLLAATKTLS